MRTKIAEKWSENWETVDCSVCGQPFIAYTAEENMLYANNCMTKCLNKKAIFFWKCKRLDKRCWRFECNCVYMSIILSSQNAEQTRET